MEPRRLLVAVDGSDASRQALEFSLKFLPAEGSHVTLVSVVPSPPEFQRHPDLAEPLLKRLRQDAQGYLRAASGIVTSRGVEVDAILREGSAVDEICQLVEGDYPDLVVLGSRGLGSQRVVLVGSVSYNVTHYTRANVLIVRDQRTVARILVPLDGSAPSGRAAEWAGDVALSQGAAVTLLYVIPQETGEAKFTVSKAVGEPFLGPLEKALKAKHIDVSKKVEYGHPGEVIVDTAEEGRYDLIAVGAQGRGAVGGFTLGGVTDKVLHYAPSSILVVR